MARNLIPIKHAETGVVYRIELANPYEDDSTEELKSRLAQEAGISPLDQILLIGPPYKQIKRLEPPLVFSSTSRDDNLPAMVTGSSGQERHIYLYNRRTLDHDTPPPEEGEFQLALVDLPNFSTISLNFPEKAEAMGSPNAMTWAPYERYFSMNVARGQAYLERAKAVLEACVRVMEEQRIQRDAGDVALTNLLEHFEATWKNFSTLLNDHKSQHGQHAALLENFEAHLSRLQFTQLHPALVEALRENMRIDRASASSADCMAFRKASQNERVTLLDCVPVGRVRSWYEQCRTAFKRLGDFIDGMADKANKLYEGVQEQKGATLPVDLRSLSLELRSLKELVTEQEKRLIVLEKNCHDAANLIRSVSRPGARAPETALVDTHQRLEEMKARQMLEGGVLWALDKADRDLVDRARSIVSHKTKSSQWLYAGLRNISRLQSGIQALRSDISMGRLALVDEARDFSHLVHVEKLPDAYEAMLIEIARRQGYMKLFEYKVNHAIDEVANFREAEIRSRGTFLKVHAVHLVPVFHQIFTSMADDPPHFQSRAMSLDQRLPHVRAEDLGKTDDDLIASYVACGGGDGKLTSVLREESLIMPPANDTELSPAQLQERFTELEHQNALLRAEIQRLSLAQKGSVNASSQPLVPPQESAVLVMSPDHEGGGHGTRGKNRVGSDEEEGSIRSGLSTVIQILEEVRKAAAKEWTLLNPSPSLTPQTQHLSGSGSSRSRSDTPVEPQPSVPAALECDVSPGLLQDAVTRVDEVSSWVISFMHKTGVELLNKRAELEQRESELQQTLRQALSTQPKISFCEFNVQDVALFLPTSNQGENRVYLAFHMSCPHRYLSYESLESIRANGSKFPDFILGKIVYIEEHCASEDPATNPYHLHPGTIYYCLTVSQDW